MKGFFTTVILLATLNLLPAQTHPPTGELFREDVLPRIDILIPPDSLAWILDPDNLESDYHFHATFIFDNGTVLDTVEHVGFRLRGNTSRYSEKKSFKVSFNTYERGRKYEGVEKLNLNGEHNDPSIARSKTCWDLARNIGLPASRSNHVLLYINDEFRGVYLNVEHIDEEFVLKRFGNNGGNLYKCLWPADLNYKGADPNLYKENLGSRRTYELKTNTDEDDYSDLAEFIDVINNTPVTDLPCELEKVFNVDAYLQAIAFDILTGNWDGPIFNKNNFYLYHNLATGQFEYIPYDLDNTFGVDWFSEDWSNRDIYNWSQSGQSRPIYSQIMAVQEYKDRFSYYLDQIMENVYMGASLSSSLDNVESHIDAWVAQDPYYPLSYGFDQADFQNSFDMALPYFHTPIGIKPFITARRSSALGQLILNDIPPIINDVQQNRPSSIQAIYISARVTDDQSVDQVQLTYFTDDPANSTTVDMLDDGQSGDGQAGDDIFGVVIPAMNEETVLQYHISAMDDQNQGSLFPRCGERTLYVGSSILPLSINEFMASNDGAYADEFGEYDDWIELYNYGDEAIYLGDKYLSDKPDRPDKWSVPNMWIDPGEYLVFWADEDPAQGDSHTNFKLSKNGEFIGIFDIDSSGFAMIDGLDFSAQSTDISFGRIPNGTGVWQVMSPTPAASNIATTIDPIAQLGIVFQASPNPFSHELNIYLENPQKLSLQLELLDLLGKQIWASSTKEDMQHQMDLSQIASGLYLLKLQTRSANILTYKLLKQ